MALVNCKECKKEISKSAKICPHCGAKNTASVIYSWIIFLVVAFVAVQCSLDINSAIERDDANRQKTFNIVIPESVGLEVKNIVADSIPAIKSFCPGLDKYSDSLVFETIEDNFAIASNVDAERVNIIFRVGDVGTSIPNEYGANGHRCFLELSRDGTKLSIPKRACQSICLDKDMSDAGSALVMPIKSSADMHKE